MIATLIRHGHQHAHVFNLYSLIEIQAYYVEAKLHEVEQFREQCVAARMSGAGNKDYKQFAASLESTVTELEAEVSDSADEINPLRTSKEINKFLGDIQKLMRVPMHQG